MRSVKQRDTKPEKVVRTILTRMGIRYRVANRDLPGSPDIANRRGKWAIFVNGCFWHGHRNCEKTKGGRYGRVPVAHRQFWREKFAANRMRDAKKCRELRAMGFKVILVWECQLTHHITVNERFRVLKLR
jgi:DNA mismatch endonuclease (patch repair protein)